MHRGMTSCGRHMVCPKFQQYAPHASALDAVESFTASPTRATADRRVVFGLDSAASRGFGNKINLGEEKTPFSRSTAHPIPSC